MSIISNVSKFFIVFTYNELPGEPVKFTLNIINGKTLKIRLIPIDGFTVNQARVMYKNLRRYIKAEFLTTIPKLGKKVDVDSQIKKNVHIHYSQVGGLDVKIEDLPNEEEEKICWKIVKFIYELNNK